jgi:hypothetical protein
VSAPEPEEPRKQREIIREMIRHEDKLRAEKLGWLLTLNGLLFAGAGFAWNTDEPGQRTALVFVLGFLGVVSGISAFVTMTLSGKAIGKLRDWSDNRPAEAWEAPVVGMRSADLGNMSWARWLQPWFVLPWGLVVVWCALPAVSAFSS